MLLAPVNRSSETDKSISSGIKTSISAGTLASEVRRDYEGLGPPGVQLPLVVLSVHMAWSYRLARRRSRQSVSLSPLRSPRHDRRDSEGLLRRNRALK